MSDFYRNPSHSKWDSKYHLVFIPKGRRKKVVCQHRPSLGKVFHALASQKEVQHPAGPFDSGSSPS
jgi:putative transposase